MEELTRELEKHTDCTNESRYRSPSLLELPAQYRELQQELRKVKDVRIFLLRISDITDCVMLLKFHTMTAMNFKEN